MKRLRIRLPSAEDAAVPLAAGALATMGALIVCAMLTLGERNACQCDHAPAMVAAMECR